MKKILIVDDSRLSRSALRRILEQEGYDTAEAGNGEEALEMLQTMKVSGIFLDLLMPVMDGFQFLEAREEAGIDAPVCVLTSDIQSYTRERLDELKADNVIYKPVRAEDVQRALGEIFGDE